MKVREKEEAPKMAAIVAMTAARSIFDLVESNDDKVEEIVPASKITSSPAVRACNPVYLNRKQGIAGLFEDFNKVIVHEDSDSEASTSIASPATLNDLDEESDPWESIGRSIEEEIEQELNICATARLKLANIDEDLIPAMSCTAKTNEAPHRPKIVAFSSQSWITMDACVARPVGRQELLQSRGAQSSMEAEWDRLRSKVVWDENIVRVSGLTLPKRLKMLELKSTSVTFLVYVLRRILSFFLVILRGSSRGALFFKGIGSLTRAGKLQISKI